MNIAFYKESWNGSFSVPLPSTILTDDFKYTTGKIPLLLLAGCAFVCPVLTKNSTW